MAISNVMSMSLISASSSMKMARIQQGIKTQMEDRAGVLKAEIKQDGGESKAEEKQKELEKVEAKAEDVEDSQMSALSELNSKLKQAAKEDLQEARAKKTIEEKRAEKDTEKKKSEAKEQEKEDEKAVTIDIVSEGVTTSAEKPEGRLLDTIV